MIWGGFKLQRRYHNEVKGIRCNGKNVTKFRYIFTNNVKLLKNIKILNNQLRYLQITANSASFPDEMQVL